MAATSHFPFLSTTEVADELGLTTGRVRQMIRAGEIPAEPVGGRGYAIPRDAVKRIKTQRAKTAASK